MNTRQLIEALQREESNGNEELMRTPTSEEMPGFVALSGMWVAFALWFAGVVCGVVGMIIGLWSQGFIK